MAGTVRWRAATSIDPGELLATTLRRPFLIDRESPAGMSVDPKSVTALVLLNHALITLAYALTPLIAAITLLGILIAVFQGAFQIEDGALAMGAKVAIVLFFAASASEMIFTIIAHLARDWIASIPTLIAQDWN